jgi:hypothetical protein
MNIYLKGIRVHFFVLYLHSVLKVKVTNKDLKKLRSLLKNEVP